MDDNIKLSKKFGYTVIIALLLISCYRYFVRHKNQDIMVSLGVLLLTVTLSKPVWLNPFRKIAIRVGDLMGRVNTFILLTLSYCLILTPLGLMMRLLGKDVLKLKTPGSQGTYWELSSKNEEGTMENQF